MFQKRIHHKEHKDDLKIGDGRWKIGVVACFAGTLRVRRIFQIVCASKPQLPSSISYLPSSKKFLCG
ncbi:MAG: hypothetical protein FJ390_01295 [Verrucomicrobia bacterium]|nr:hypothetical protein [Verrucomicrobiota bacterium]